MRLRHVLLERGRFLFASPHYFRVHLPVRVSAMASALVCHLTLTTKRRGGTIPITSVKILKKKINYQTQPPFDVIQSDARIVNTWRLHHHHHLPDDCGKWHFFFLIHRKFIMISRGYEWLLVGKHLRHIPSTSEKCVSRNIENSDLRRLKHSMTPSVFFPF